MKRTTARMMFTAVIIFFLVLGVFTGVQAEPYYKGKVITLIVGVGAGGGADITARMVANHLGRFIPGNPSIVIQNMPAADGLVAANTIWHAKGDGKKILFGAGKNVTANLLRPAGTEFKLQEMPPLYASPFGVVFYFKPGLVASPRDLPKAEGLIWGHGSPTGGTSSSWIFAKALIGFKSKDILGYSGSGPAKLAFLSGESNCMGGGSDGYRSSFKSEADKGEIMPLFQSGLLDPGGNVVRDKLAPPVPTTQEVYEMIYGKSPSGPMYDVYKMTLSTRTYDSPVLMPPSTPAEYVNILRKAFVDMVKDPEFLKAADKIVPGCTHITGDELVKGFASQVAGDEKTIKYMKDYLTENYGVKF